MCPQRHRGHSILGRVCPSPPTSKQATRHLGAKGGSQQETSRHKIGYLLEPVTHKYSTTFNSPEPHYTMIMIRCECPELHEFHYKRLNSGKEHAQEANDKWRSPVSLNRQSRKPSPLKKWPPRANREQNPEAWSPGLLSHASLAQAHFHVWKCTFPSSEARLLCWISVSCSFLGSRDQEPRRRAGRGSPLCGNNIFHCTLFLIEDYALQLVSCPHSLISSRTHPNLAASFPYLIVVFFEKFLPSLICQILLYYEIGVKDERVSRFLHGDKRTICSL